jgi:outer membrane receptor protein involved in Fe transport
MKTRYLLSCAAAALLGGAATGAAADDASGVVATASSSSIAAAVDAAGSSSSQITATAGAAADTTNSATVEEIVVSAERREETVQNVPMTVQAFSGQTLSQNNVLTLDDVIKYTPNVTFGQNGPGQGVIFMRGLSAGLQGGQSSATIATFPNVALYLDDQSMQFPGRNVDIYAVDLDRIEVLEGPQGTLFGGGAEAGAVRYITNKPKLDEFEGHAEGTVGDTTGGAANYAGNAMLNIPVIKDKFALRVVVYDDRQGGYIDNVPSTFTRSNEDLGNKYFNIHPSGSPALCPNGLPGGGPLDLCTPPNTPQGNNFNIAGPNSNPVTYTGARISALFQVTDDWDVLIQQSFQDLDAEGVSAEYPLGSDFQPLGSLQATIFSPSWDHDNFENTSWTINGKLGPIKAVYTGGYMDRHIDQQMDYTNYSRSNGGYYYECTGPGTGFGSLPTTCYSPVTSWRDIVRSTHLSNELRFSTPDTWRLRGIVGAFEEQFRIYDDMNFNYKTIPACTPANLANDANVTCVADTMTAPGSTANDPGIRSDTTAFGEDTQRGYDQTALFASFDYDIIPKVLTVTLGTRWYDYNEFMVGSQYGTSTGCTDVPNGDCFDQANINSHNDHVTYEGFKSRANVTWHVTPDTMTYFTFSQGFRPGGFNRTVGAEADLIELPNGKGADPQFEKPNGYPPDSLDNYEIGFKTELLDHRVQVNLSAYHMDWYNVQLLFFNPATLGNTTFGVPGPNYAVNGGEYQIVARVTDQLTITTSGSYNDDEQSSSPCLIDNIATPSSAPNHVPVGSCITTIFEKGVGVVPLVNPFGALGSTPAFSPKFEGDIRARYEWVLADDYKAHAQVSAQYISSMYNEPATYPSGSSANCSPVPNTTLCRYEMPGYGTVDAAIGIAKDKWSVELYGTNLADSHASVLTASEQFIKYEVPIRPRVVALKIAADF